jgi:hypothetical protein
MVRVRTRVKSTGRVVDWSSVKRGDLVEKSFLDGSSGKLVLFNNWVVTAGPEAAEFLQPGSRRCRPVAARRVGAQLQRSWSWSGLRKRRGRFSGRERPVLFTYRA